MKCFYHPQTDAVGFCRNCQKGLCKECVADLGNGIACKDRCERQVEGIIKLVEQSKDAYRTASRNAYWAAGLLGIIGTLFILFGNRTEQGDAFFFLGLVMLALGAFYCRTGRTYQTRRRSE